MRTFIGVICARCRAYFRIYKDPSGRFYEGRCFRCGRSATALVDSRRGIKRRFFLGR